MGTPLLAHITKLEGQLRELRLKAKSQQQNGSLRDLQTTQDQISDLSTTLDFLAQMTTTIDRF